ncbi:glycosyltransferase family 2 protein [Williamsia sp. CHRR-6]|uniref:glycosyltransferase family 2 protein n=1 Tax=Williamsia sp. CHRR-6 TaxID=2835871 RepID=UPI001BD9EC1A|nr:glycosyltransferase family 2 protein [Williamsia sp. CHRR-6]MBT0565780.1 glycosyltransferase family 2 protein [Williamsia sp. CHRR-6]
MKMHTLSVVIPVYNEAQSIERCLEQLCAQRAPIHEIVVVDNNSTDDTATIVKDFATDHPQVNLISEQRQGALHAAARGLAEATGDLIAKIDADTLVLPAWSDNIAAFFAVAPADMAGGSGMCTMHDMPWQRPFAALQRRMSSALTAKLARGEFSEMADSFGANFVMRAQAWRDIADKTSTRNDIQDDLDIGITVVAAGWRLALIPGMDATISGRRLCTSPRSYWRYSARTPRTFRMHGRTGDFVRSMIGVTAARIAHALCWPALRLWDPQAHRFRLRSTQTDRVLP